MLKSSLALKDGELDSTIAALNQQKKNYLLLEREFDDLSQSHDKLLIMFDAFWKDTQKSEAIFRGFVAAILLLMVILSTMVVSNV